SSFCRVSSALLSRPWVSTLSLHDALPILRHAAFRCDCRVSRFRSDRVWHTVAWRSPRWRSFRPDHGFRGTRQVGLPFAAYAADRLEEHTSELQSPCNLVCRLLLEKKKNNT